MLARDRVELVLDEDSPFLELLPLCGWGQVRGRKEEREGGSECFFFFFFLMCFYLFLG